MSEHVPDAKLWFAGIVFFGLAGLLGYSLPHVQTATPVKAPAEPVGKPAPQAFTPPLDAEPTDDKFGEMVLLGERIFNDTAANAGKFVGNDLRCANCHLDGGRLPNSAPLWAAFVNFPTYRSKNDHVNTFAERLQGCFNYSMNGKAPPLGDKVLIALESYAAYLAKGARVGENLPGRGYPKLAKLPKLDVARGERVYTAKCAVCHGGGGEGQATTDGHVVFPPLWGSRSYNWGAGMSSVTNAAGFIKANMPLSQGGTLNDEDAWAVAAYIDSRERPQDPRFNGSVAETRKAHHDSDYDFYGKTVDGRVLGETSPPSGTVPR